MFHIRAGWRGDGCHVGRSSVIPVDSWFGVRRGCGIGARHRRRRECAPVAASCEGGRARRGRAGVTPADSRSGGALPPTSAVRDWRVGGAVAGRLGRWRNDARHDRKSLTERIRASAAVHVLRVRFAPSVRVSPCTGRLRRQRGAPGVLEAALRRVRRRGPAAPGHSAVKAARRTPGVPRAA